jgi:hypothetical protein
MQTHLQHLKHKNQDWHLGLPGTYPDSQKHAHAQNEHKDTYNCHNFLLQYQITSWIRWSCQHDAACHPNYTMRSATVLTQNVDVVHQYWVKSMSKLIPIIHPQGETSNIHAFIWLCAPASKKTQFLLQILKQKVQLMSITSPDSRSSITFSTQLIWQNWHKSLDFSSNKQGLRCQES